MKIAKEGYPTIALVGTIVGLICLCSWLYLPSWMFIALSILLLPIWLLSIYFFRDPERYLPPNYTQEHILSPADGKVVIVKEIEESEYLKSDAIQISIFLSPLNVHINRNPLSGTLEYLSYMPGEYLMAWDERASMDNEQAKFGVKHSSGKKILFRQITGFLARRIVYYLSEGDQLEAGKRFGLMKFGSRMDVVVPKDSKIFVKEGDRTVAGVSVIAELSRS